MIIGFSVLLRGGEVPIIAIEGMVAFWEETRAHQNPHIMIALEGKFKGENNLRRHCVPIADQTKSGIPTQRLISRMLYQRTRVDKDRICYLFARSKGCKASLGDYDPLFRDYLERKKRLNPSYSRLQFLSMSLAYEGCSRGEQLQKHKTATWTQ